MLVQMLVWYQSQLGWGPSASLARSPEVEIESEEEEVGRK